MIEYEPAPSSDAPSTRGLGHLRSAMLAERGERALAEEDYRSAIDLIGQALSVASQENVPEARTAALHRIHAAALIGGGYHGRGRAEARTSADLCRKTADALGEARALYHEAVACFQLGDYTAGLGVARTGLLVLQETPENEDIGNLQLILGSILVHQGEWNEALNVFHDSLASFRRSRNEWSVARANSHLAVVYKNLGRLDQAIELSEKAEEMAARLGRSTAAFALNQGIARYWKGDHEGAEQCFLRTLAASKKTGDMLRETRALLALGRLYMDRGQMAEARLHLERAGFIADEKQYRREMVLAHQYMGDIALRANDIEDAGARWQKAEALAERIAPGSDLRAAIWTRQSELALVSGDLTRAIDLGTRAVNAAIATGVVHDKALALIARAQAAQALSCREEAHQGFTEGFNLLRTAGVRFELALSLAKVGRMLAADSRRDSRDEGFRLLDEAGEHFGILGEGNLLAGTLLDIVDYRLEGGEMDLAQSALRKLRIEVAGENSRLGGTLGSRLATLEETLSQRMGENAASQDNPFRRLERSGHLHNRLHDSSEPEGDLLRSLLDSTGSDRGFLALAPTLGAGPIRVVACQDLPAREAEGIARTLWLSSPGNSALATMPGISVSPGWDRRFAGSPLEGQNDVGSNFWVRIAREERESALVYADRLEQEGFRPYGQMDLSLATSLTHLLALALDNLELRRILRDPARRQGLITQDPRMLRILEDAARVEGDLEIILLQGETGTGKNHLAHALHQMSGREKDKFKSVRCTDVTETLVESELFGHEAGAFTDARRQRDGLLAKASGGTIFIDEIDKASIKFQSRLLGVLDERVYKPVGGSYQKLEGRIICASAKNLNVEVKEQRFLGELYYRLGKFTFTLPPLRERRGDIPLLTEFFLQEARKARKRETLRLTPEGLNLIMSYPWPGNVRDLEHEIGRGATFADASGLIGPHAFSEELQDWWRNVKLAGEAVDKVPAGEEPGPAGGSAHAVAGKAPIPKTISIAVCELEAKMVREALERNHGVKSRAARELGLTRRGLDLKIARYGLNGNTPAGSANPLT